MNFHLYLIGVGVCLVVLMALVKAGVFDRYIK